MVVTTLPMKGRCCGFDFHSGQKITFYCSTYPPYTATEPISEGANSLPGTSTSASTRPWVSLITTTYSVHLGNLSVIARTHCSHLYLIRRFDKLFIHVVRDRPVLIFFLSLQDLDADVISSCENRTILTGLKIVD